MAKRHVSSGPASGADAAPPPTAEPAAEPAAPAASTPRAANGTFTRATTAPADQQQAADAPQVEVREWKNDDTPFDGMHASLEELVAESDRREAAGGAAAAGAKPTDGAAPAAGGDTPAAGDAQAAATTTPAADAAPVYLTREQRAELATRLEQERQQQGLQGTLQAAQQAIAERDAQLARFKSGKVLDVLEAAGIDPNAAFDELMMTGAGAQPAGGDAGAAADPTVAALKAEVEALKRTTADRETRERTAQETQVRQQAIAATDRVIQAQAAEFPMVARMRGAERVFDEAQRIWNETVRPGTVGAEARAAGLNPAEVAQVAAQRVEEKMRVEYPGVFELVGTGAAAAAGTPTATGAAAAAAPAPPAAPARAPAARTPVVGSRTEPPTAEAELDIPLDAPDRHAQIRAMVFGRARS